MSHIWLPPKGAMPWSEALSEFTYFPSVKFKGAKPAGTTRTPRVVMPSIGLSAS